MIGHGRYAGVVGGTFSLMDGTELVLSRVSEPVEQGPFTTWSLIFHGPADRQLEQGIQRLAHPELGEEEIFLVPVAAIDDRIEYEALFSRAAEGAES